MSMYESGLAKVRHEGVLSKDRTGVGTLSYFGLQMRFDLRGSFPLITSKRVHWKGVVGELLWMLSGSTSAKELKEKYDVSIWDEWANAGGELGPIYGKQWRAWEGIDNTNTTSYTPRVIDQIRWVVDEIRKNPNSRRLIVSAWNVNDLDAMALMPCHAMFQFYVRDGKLSCQLYQRSADMFLGVPFNIASYALLTHMVASCCGLEVGEFIWTGGDCHLYLNHVTQADIQLARPFKPTPQIKLDNHGYQYPWEFKPEDIHLIGYDPHPAIKGDVAV